jgi:hypothetical protein
MVKYNYMKLKYSNRVTYSFPDEVYQAALQRMRQMDVSFQELARIAMAFYLNNTDQRGNSTQETKSNPKDAAKNH